MTATPTATGAEIVIMLRDTEVPNGGNATWETGENVLTITVRADATHSTEYTVTVTKS